jgi:hypothetical protein
MIRFEVVLPVVDKIQELGNLKCDVLSSELQKIQSTCERCS